MKPVVLHVLCLIGLNHIFDDKPNTKGSLFVYKRRFKPTTKKKDIMKNQEQENKAIYAPEFNVKDWVDANGNKTDQVKLSDFKGKFKVVYCFQSWCPGCHSVGLPNLQKMVEALKDNENVAFLAIQTVFEGHHENTYAKMLETQKKYELKIPFGHDAGDDGKSRSNFMQNYQTGGTPWFVFIDQNNEVVFADFHINVDAAIKALKNMGEDLPE